MQQREVSEFDPHLFRHLPFVGYGHRRPHRTRVTIAIGTEETADDGAEDPEL